MKETKFKNTEIGRIPEEWETLYIHQITEISTGATPSTNINEYWENGTIRWMSSGELNDKIIYDVNGRITQKGYDNTGTHMLPKNCVLIGLAGQGKTRGTAAYNKVELCTNQSIAAILPNSKYESKYLYFYIDSLYDKLRLLSAGDGGRGGLNKQILQNLEIAMPPLNEQHHIASALTSIDNLISSLGKLIEKKKNIKQGAMRQLLTGKTRLKGFNEPWMEHTIDELFDLGNGYTPSKSNPAYWTNGTIPWFRMEDIRTNGRILKDSIQHVTPEAVKGNGLYPKYSIILSTTATIGEHALLIADSLANQQFTFLNRKVNRRDMIDIIFFYHYCFILGKWCRDNINAGGLLAVNMDDLKNHSIYIPKSIAEQQAIATILTKMDDEITALEAQRAKYEAIKQGMMQQLLTGKIRLIS